MKRLDEIDIPTTGPKDEVEELHREIAELVLALAGEGAPAAASRVRLGDKRVALLEDCRPHVEGARFALVELPADRDDFGRRPSRLELTIADRLELPVLVELGRARGILRRSWIEAAAEEVLELPLLVADDADDPDKIVEVFG